jgi:hypothetical protein
MYDKKLILSKGEINVKLFFARICCSRNTDEFDSELIVAETQEEAKKKMKEKFSDFMEYFQWVEADEVTEVEGWKITLSK